MRAIEAELGFALILDEEGGIWNLPFGNTWFREDQLMDLLSKRRVELELYMKTWVRGTFIGLACGMPNPWSRESLLWLCRGAVRHA